MRQAAYESPICPNRAVLSDASGTRKPDVLSLTFRSALSATTRHPASKQQKLIIEENKKPNSPSQASFAETWPHKHGTNGAALFESTNYKTYGHVSIQPHELSQVKALMDTTVSPKPGSELFFYSTWKTRIKYRNFSKLNSANKQPVGTEEMMLLYLKIGYLRIRVRFKVADVLVKDLWTSPSFIDE